MSFTLNDAQQTVLPNVVTSLDSMPVLETHDGTAKEEKAHFFDGGFVSILHFIVFSVYKVWICSLTNQKGRFGMMCLDWLIFLQFKFPYKGKQTCGGLNGCNNQNLKLLNDFWGSFASPDRQYITFKLEFFT